MLGRASLASPSCARAAYGAHVEHRVSFFLSSRAQACSVCDASRAMVRTVACSAAQGLDTVCASCARHTFVRDGACVVCAACGAGAVRSAPCGGESDTQCRNCTSTQWAAGLPSESGFPTCPGLVCFETKHQTARSGPRPAQCRRRWEPTNALGSPTHLPRLSRAQVGGHENTALPQLQLVRRHAEASARDEVHTVG